MVLYFVKPLLTTTTFLNLNSLCYAKSVITEHPNIDTKLQHASSSLTPARYQNSKTRHSLTNLHQFELSLELIENTLSEENNRNFSEDINCQNEQFGMQCSGDPARKSIVTTHMIETLNNRTLNLSLIQLSR